MKYNLLLILLLSLIPAFASTQSAELHGVLEWKGVIKEQISENTFSEYMYFEGAFTDPTTSLPLFTDIIDLPSANVEISAEFTSAVFEPLNPIEISYLSNKSFNSEQIEIEAAVALERKVPIGIINFIPLRINPTSKQFEKLVSFKILVRTKPLNPPQPKSSNEYVDHSILSSGEWFKIKVQNTGLYKISYSDFLNYGISPSEIDPGNIRVYGNGVGMLPELTDDFRFDDLIENAIFVSGEDDGSFDEGDYIIFFGRSPHQWKLNSHSFNFINNLYDEFNYYYITSSFGPGKRLENQSSTDNPTNIATTYNSYDVWEEDNINIIDSGKEWYGDEFGIINKRQYDFSIPEVVTSEDVFIRTSFATRTLENDFLVITVNDNYSDTVEFQAIGHPLATRYAKKNNLNFQYNTNSQNFHIDLEYFASSGDSRTWLNFIEINAVSELKLLNDQLVFRKISNEKDNSITRFIISNTNENTQVWEITDHLNPKIIETDFDDNELIFTLQTDLQREFIAFKESMYYSPEFAGIVINQDLHGTGPVDMVIVTHPLFMEAADTLKKLHEDNDNLSILITTPEEIYNEFSSGSQDPTAIRDFMKMLYDNHEGQEPRFLLLLGDGSFDPKERIENNTNFIPTFQTEESLNTASSYVIDDYFGCLDENEGNDGRGVLDIGIGRIPVQTIEQAQEIIAKIKKYIQKTEPIYGNWRDKICIIADDEDGNLHLEQADSLADGLIPKNYNINKIYLDSYPQISTPIGNRYPDVNDELYKQIEKGVLIMNYVGHGGVTGWAKERILQISDINKWENPDIYPVFITATCEFSRFDEPGIVTGGETILLKPKGGGIALFTTTRLAFSQSNFSLNRRIYDSAFIRTDGEYPFMGDLIRLSKPPGQLTTRNFVLLGDPALKIAYPEYDIKTVKINNINTENGSVDTLKALREITVKGEVTDFNGEKATGFDGIITPVLYDKFALYNTIGNDVDNSYPVEFHCQDKVLWRGKTSVINGDFSFSFIVPKDIAFDFGNGKLSYYAISNDADAGGYYNDFIIGGIDENAVADTEGPQINLFLNDTNFISGQQVIKNSVLLAFLYDIHGLNLSENGIGHDIVAVLDNDFFNSIVLNDIYEPVIDSYQSGTITFPFEELANGKHTLTLKAWDSYNNSSEATIEFFVDSYAKLTLNQVKNFPNPFKNSTTFTFTHTRPGDNLNIELQIFDLTGKLILSYNNSISTVRTEVNFLEWDGTDSDGNKLNNGMYIYSVIVKDESGTVSRQTQKLILMN